MASVINRTSDEATVGRLSVRARQLLDEDLSALMREANALRIEGHGHLQSYSRKVFIPLTQLCRDRCHYCTFSRRQSPKQAAYLTKEQVLAIARAGRAAGCTEALFTLGDKPELRYAVARDALAEMGYASTIEYLVAMCEAVIQETGLLPHVNAGTMSRDEMLSLRRVSVSQGLMLESSAIRLSDKGGPHYRSPDKDPAVRLETTRLAGELSIPFTSGLLIGIGETRAERLEALEDLKRLHDQYGHIQEIIIQNFRAKANTPMAAAAEPTVDELVWTIAAARILFGPRMNIQAPPNLSAGALPSLLSAGINDWGGVSPVTVDHVNPEAPWPEVARLAEVSAASGRVLIARLPVYPAYMQALHRWQDPAMATALRHHADATGWARDDAWSPGLLSPPALVRNMPQTVGNPALAPLLDEASQGRILTAEQIVTLFEARGTDVARVLGAANALRQTLCGDTVSFVVNRNINYTNICSYRCGFCAFAKGSTDERYRGKPYDLDLEEIVRRATEADARGATEVCLQGGIHPHYTGETYLSICRAIKAAVPEMHIHAFSPLEIRQGAATLGISVRDFLLQLKDAGLSTLPGTAAEILDDEVREIICPDKLNTAQWLEVLATAHEVGLRTTSTIMFGHVEQPIHWARHLLHVRALQAKTGGITEFVPLPFVHMEAPLYRKGLTRLGPTFREVLLMHAVARLVLHPLIPNIQASWVKLGAAGIRAVLDAGVNDLGGTLMNESISRAAGTEHGQEFPPQAMRALILDSGRSPRQRSTLYGDVTAQRQDRGLEPATLAPMILTPPRVVRRAASLAHSID